MPEAWSQSVVFRGLAVLLLLLVPLGATAAEKKRWTWPEKPRFVIAVGMSVVRFDTTFRFDSDALGPGTTIDAENVLGLEEDQVDFRLDGQ